jgi:hypothetical protein
MAATLAASSIVSVWPSRDLTIRFWPLSLSTVPRMRVGVRAGGVWARAGPTDRAMRAAIAILSALPFYSRRQQRLTRRWRTEDSNPRSPPRDRAQFPNRFLPTPRREQTPSVRGDRSARLIQPRQRRHDRLGLLDDDHVPGGGNHDELGAGDAATAPAPWHNRSLRQVSGGGRQDRRS